jgi:hypothetical protein
VVQDSTPEPLDCNEEQCHPESRPNVLIVVFFEDYCADDVADECLDENVEASDSGDGEVLS